MSGSSTWFTAVRRTAATVVAGFALLCYLYGPALATGTRTAAHAQCNTVAGGDYRSYRLDWRVGPTPHWVCRDARQPGAPGTDLGWWTNPF
ncbi:MAG: hypothetical protein WB441_16930 [Nocardioidaceae bacterium]